MHGSTNVNVNILASTVYQQYPYGDRTSLLRRKYCKEHRTQALNIYSMISLYLKNIYYVFLWETEKFQLCLSQVYIQGQINP